MTVFLPARYLAGVGCRKGAGADEIVALILAVVDEADIKIEALDAIGTLDRKLAEPGLVEAARRLGIALRAWSLDELTDVLPPSPGPIADHIGLPGVAEAVVRKSGMLVVPKRKSANATCALGLYSPNAAMASSSVATSVAGP